MLHVGTMKTASSSIQATLFAGRERLAAQGIRYFARAANHSDLYAVFADEPDRYPPLARRGLLSPEARAAEIRAWQADLARFLAAPGQGILLISDENLADLGPAGVARLRAAIAPHVDRVRVIAYARPPVAFAQSMAQQVIKEGATFADIARATLTGSDHGPARPFRASVHPAYRARIGPYLEVFGPDSVEIRPFDPHRFPEGDAVEDFLIAALGRGAAALGLERHRVNESLDHAAVLLLEALNHLQPPQPDGRLHSARAANLLPRIKGVPAAQPFRLPGFDWDGFARVVAPDCDWLAEVTGGAIRFRVEPPAEPGPPDLSSLALFVNALAAESAAGRAQGAVLRAFMGLRLGRADAPARLSRALDAVQDAQLLRVIARALRADGAAELAAHAARLGEARGGD
ncbi:MAG: hypothetical protein D6686_16345, partial [Alphaproteobacteria bacterium]